MNVLVFGIAFVLEEDAEHVEDFVACSGTLQGQIASYVLREQFTIFIVCSQFLAYFKNVGNYILVIWFDFVIVVFVK